MLDMAYYKYDLGELKNPIIDTLNLSRIINRDLKRHSLAALGKAYGIDTGEADEEEENSDIPSGSKKLDDQTGSEIIDIKVDGQSIIRTIEVEYSDAEITDERRVNKVKKEHYLETTYKASKTEKVTIEVELAEGYELIDFNSEYTLHPAENSCEFKYITPFGEKTINVIVYVGQHHGADVDSENTGYIFNKMLKQIEGIKH
jgi:hypothetical protein